MAYAPAKTPICEACYESTFSDRDNAVILCFDHAYAKDLKRAVGLLLERWDAPGYPAVNDVIKELRHIMKKARQ